MADRTTLIAALAAAACIAAVPAQEPDVRQLVRRLADDQRREEAQRDLEALGAQAVPVLIEALGDERSPHVAVLAVLDRLGPEAAPALPAVTALLDPPSSDDVRAAAAHSASTLAPYAGAEERKRAEDKMLAVFMGGPGRGAVRVNWHRQLLAVARFLHRVEIDVDNPPAKVAEHLESDSPYHRELAAEILARRGTAEQAPMLRDALTGTHPRRVQARWETAGGSGSFGTSVDHAEVIRLAAARALVAVAGTRPEGAPGHAWLLQHGDPVERLEAGRTIGRYGVLDEDREDLAKALASALDGDTAVVREVLPAIGLVGVVADSTRARLKQMAEGDDPQTAARAAAVLRQLDR